MWRLTSNPVAGPCDVLAATVVPAGHVGPNDPKLDKLTEEGSLVVAVLHGKGAREVG